MLAQIKMIFGIDASVGVYRDAKIERLRQRLIIALTGQDGTHGLPVIIQRLESETLAGVAGEVRRLKTRNFSPIPAKGMQGLWELNLKEEMLC